MVGTDGEGREVRIARDRLVHRAAREHPPRGRLANVVRGLIVWTVCRRIGREVAFEDAERCPRCFA